MEILRNDPRARPTKALKSPAGHLRVHREPETRGIRLALQALGEAYGRVAGALHDRMQDSGCGVEELSTIGSSYGWVADRRRLVENFLASEPAVIAYAYDNVGSPDHIRALAETAAELAGERHSLISALGLLHYIERELGWSSISAAAAGRA